MSRQITAEEFEKEAMPYLHDLYRTAVRLVLDRGAAEDLVQEVYMQAWKSFHKYELGTNCRAWLFKILFHKVEHHRRRLYAQERWLITGDGDELIAETVASEPPVDAHLTDEEILRALDELPVRYREIVLLADVEELSYKEIADILEIPLGTVMSRLSRGRKQLRDSLARVALEYGIGAAAAAPPRRPQLTEDPHLVPAQP